MNKEEITIAGLIKLIESGDRENIRLRNWQLAQLFGVYESAVRANIKSIIKSKIVIPDYNSIHVQTGGILLPEVYGLDMVIALVFRLDSANASKFREWIMTKLFVGKDNILIHIGLDNLQSLN